MRAGDRFARTRLPWQAVPLRRLVIGRLSLRDHQIPEEHVVDQRGFSRPRNPGDTCENSKRKVDVDVLQVVLSRATDLDR